MANKFKVGTLVLNSQNVTIDGNRLRVGNSGVLYSGENYGSFITNSNLAGLIQSGDVSSTYSTISNLNLTGLNSLNRDIAVSGLIETSGTSLQNQINTERNKNTVTGASISGGISITGTLNINAGANISLTQAGLNTFSIIGSSVVGLATSGNLESTGTAIQNQVNTITAGTGNLYSKNNSDNFIPSGNIIGGSGINVGTSGSFRIIAPYPFSKGITVELPAAGNDINLFYTPRPLNVNSLYAYLSGDTTPVVNYSLKFGTGRLNMIGTEVNVGGLAVTSVNTGAQQFTFNNSYISGNTFTWLIINSTGGNPKQFSLTMYLNYI